MSRIHSFLGTALIAGALLVAGPGSAWAQHQGGGGHAGHGGGGHAVGHVSSHSAHVGGVAHTGSTWHGNVGHVGTWHGGTAWHGNAGHVSTWHGNPAWHGNNFHHDFDHNHFYGNRAIFGLGYSPWWYGYYPGYSYYPATDYYTNYYNSYYAAPDVYSDYYTAYTPDIAATIVSQASVATTAQMEVLLPDPNAQVLIEGKPTTITGTVRYFESPPLETGKTYVYHLAATWLENGKAVQVDKTVAVEPGRQFVVDFRQQG